MRATSGVNPTEGQFLAWLTQTYVMRMAVEIGSCEGRSACYILDALKDINSHAVLNCVDLWDLGQNITPPKQSTPKAFARFRKNIVSLGLSSHVIIYKGYSRNVAKQWKEVIDLLFIDGGHTYKDVLTDYEAWSPFVRVGGVMAFHDANQADVGRVISSLPASVWESIPTDQSERISAFIRKE